MLTIKIVADREGFAEHLAGLRRDHLEQAKAADAKSGERTRQNGIAEGLAFALDALGQWEEPPASPDGGPFTPGLVSRSRPETVSP